MEETKSSEVECQRVAQMTLGYIEALIEGMQTIAARELLMDWKFIVERSQQKDGDSR
jgi:hypothetical protein